MGNSSTSKVEEIGSICLKIHDGIVRTLEIVKHVLVLWNLNSLSKLDSQGLRFNGQDGSIKVTRCALVFMKLRMSRQ